MLWDKNQIDNFEGDINDVIAIKNVNINEYNGIKNLFLQHFTIFLINPEITEKQE